MLKRVPHESDVIIGIEDDEYINNSDVGIEYNTKE
jgi:hypothetical protein